MKFLIAALFLCTALVGQIQGGSLRGLKVQMPHQVYGAPVLEHEIHIDETEPLVEDKETTLIEEEKHEEPIISKPSPEYGAPGVVAEVESIPFEDSLPHVERPENFGTPSNMYLPPATQKPDLPYLEPGFPTLPEAPVLPVEEPIREVPNTYLPPVMEVESTPVPVKIEEPHKPSDVYGPPPTAEVQEYPEVAELPSIPELPEVPVEEEMHGGYHYARPEGPMFELPKVTVHAPEPVVLAKEVKPQLIYTAPTVAKVHVERSHFIDIPRVLKTEHVLVQPALPVQTVKHYKVPTKDIHIPVAVPAVHGLVSHSEYIQNHASSASSSSLQVNKYVVPSHIPVQPSFTHDTVLVEDLKPIGAGFTIESIHSGNSEKTSTGSFNHHHVSVVSNELPHLSSFGGGFLGRVPVVKEAHSTPLVVPQAAYGAPHF